MPSHRLYGVLELPQGASGEEIKRAYKRLAIRLHPDKPGGDADKFKELSRAYSLLSDPAARARYDELGDGGFDAPPPPSPQSFFGGDPAGIFAQMFGEAFGAPRDGRRSDPAQRSVQDHVLTLSLEQAFAGTTRVIKVTLQRACQECAEDCYACQGKGSITHLARHGFLTSMTQRPCDACRGAGRVSKGCAGCGSKGVVHEERRHDVKLPPGVRHGQSILIPGGGAAPDIRLEVRILPHETFARDGDDLRCTIRLGVREVILGKEASLRHLDGAEVAVRLEGVVDMAAPVVLAGKGMPRVGLPAVAGAPPPRGDLVVQLAWDDDGDRPRKWTEAEAAVLARAFDAVGLAAVTPRPEP